MTLVQNNFEVEYTGLLVFIIGVILLVALMAAKH